LVKYVSLTYFKPFAPCANNRSFYQLLTKFVTQYVTTPHSDTRKNNCYILVLSCVIRYWRYQFGCSTFHRTLCQRALWDLSKGKKIFYARILYRKTVNLVNQKLWYFFLNKKDKILDQHILTKVWSIAA
jgi:hypothetical protein